MSLKISTLPIIRSFVPALTLAIFASQVISAQEIYDYIVVGSGPGGGPLAVNLARAGYKTFLEAGDDRGDDPNWYDLRNNYAAVNSPLARWDYFVQHSEDPEDQARYQLQTYRTTNGSFHTGPNPPSGAERLGIWYPRGTSPGGCSMNNAAITSLPPDADWEIIVNRTGDQSWSPENMRQHFINIERNEWLPRGTPGHRFDGWLRINQANNSWVQPTNNVVNIFRGLSNITDQDPDAVPELIVRDINSANPDRDNELGFSGMSRHVDGNNHRPGHNTYIRDTLNDTNNYPLIVQLRSFVTRVLFDESGPVPTANGVEVLRGEAGYRADSR